VGGFEAAVATLDVVLVKFAATGRKWFKKHLFIAVNHNAASPMHCHDKCMARLARMAVAVNAVKERKVDRK